MAGVHILTDGAATLPRDADLNYGITILPHALRWGGEILRLGAELSPEDAIRRWSAASPDDVTAPFPDEVLAATGKILDWGVEVVAIRSPSTVAMTVDHAKAVIAAWPDEPGVSVVEPAWLGPALGLMAISAAHAGAEGAARQDVVNLLAAIGEQLECIVVRPQPVAVLTRETPRQSPTRESSERWQLEKLLGSELTPVADPEPLGEAMRRAVDYVHQRLAVTESYEGPLHMALFTADADAESAALATFFEQRYAPHELWVAPADPVLLGLAGIPAFGVAWYRLPAPVEFAV